MTETSTPGFHETLANIISSRTCTSCAACIIVCPFNCLEYVEGHPEITSECQNCGICANVCPQYHPSQSQLETFVFGRTRKPEEKFGVYQHIFVAKSTNPNILNAGQDGGVVTTLLTFALNNHLIDGAALSGTDLTRPLHPIPLLATTQEQILQSAGTRYSYSPNLLALHTGIEHNQKNLAFVGTPCQIEAIRKIQMIPLKPYTETLKLTIGLMCSTCFSYEGLVEHYIKENLGVNPADIRKINIKRNLLLTMQSGETKIIPLKEIQPYRRENCRACTDFSAELADISVGGLGLTDQSLVITRTDKGQNLFIDAVKANKLKVTPLQNQTQTHRLLASLSTKKRDKQN